MLPKRTIESFYETVVDKGEGEGRIGGLIEMEYPILVFTKSVDSNFRAFWLVPVTKISLDIHCFANREKNGASFRESFGRRNCGYNLIKTAFFYPSNLVNTKTTIPHGWWRAVDIYLNASRLGIYPPLFTSPSGDSCILFSVPPPPPLLISICPGWSLSTA